MRSWTTLVVALSLTAPIASGCSDGPSSSLLVSMMPRMSKAPFGRTKDGVAVDLVTLRNEAGTEVGILTYGGVIRTLKTADRTGTIDDIVLGFDTLLEYEEKSPFFGTLVGRYGNRIAKGQFTLDGRTYTLAKNNGPNHLHGGNKGWDKAVWAAGDPFQNATGVGVSLSHTSPDGDEGYPGTVRAVVTYTLTDANELIVEYEATSDKPTVINLTQHSYFNLGGAKTPDVLGHELMLNADGYTPVDAGLIPLGPIAPVAGTPFDFRTQTPIGERIGAAHEQIAHGNGYDHNFVLNHSGDGLSPAARVVEPATGRTMTVRTTEPGVQFYTGNFLDGTLTGKGGRVYGRRAGFCLETQHYPDSPNKPNFPSTVLRPDQTYRSRTVFTFGAAKPIQLAAPS
jgi:aldose 1-epimerase